ncbi:hypothetical protein EB796_012661 [Bugula neritina]|uniref:RGS7 n=1 Tax=Bugula neritina TaxID=10212 RepID=A0A7J7JRR2_BUGNE|nr:hypothetical protein EB796_012661 [Bugula neritina]
MSAHKFTDNMSSAVGYNPNLMDELVERMCSADVGIPIKTEKSFRTRTPSVFTGAAVINWIQTNLGPMDLAESMHLSHMIAAHGYIFPIDDHILTVKNDASFYRFQTKFFWLSRCTKAENSDYAVYLCKRAMYNKSRTTLADYEMDSLSKLQHTLQSSWQYVVWQAEEQIKVDKKRDKTERKILDSQERAFWDLHRPAPGCISTTEVDRRKLNRMKPKILPYFIRGCPDPKGSPTESLKGQIEFLKRQLDRRRQKLSKVYESLKNYSNLYNEFDEMLTPSDQGSPWIVENTDFWDSEASNAVVSQRRYKRWEISITELLKDPVGYHQFAKFLQKEFSAENLDFYADCRQVKALPMSQVPQKVAEIYQLYLVEDAKYLINVDAQVAEQVRKSTCEGGGRYSFDPAEEHIFNLMKNDSYTRFIRSDDYKDYVNNMSRSKTPTLSKLSIFVSKPMLSLSNSNLPS